MKSRAKPAKHAKKSKPQMTQIFADFPQAFVDAGLESTLTPRVQNQREKSPLTHLRT